MNNPLLEHWEDICIKVEIDFNSIGSIEIEHFTDFFCIVFYSLLHLTLLLTEEYVN